MSEIKTFGQLRAQLPARGWYEHDLIVGPEEAHLYNPEASYVVMPLERGGFHVTVKERGKTLYDETFPDERSTVAALDRQFITIPMGPPVTAEERAASRERAIERKRLILLRAQERLQAAGNSEREG